MRYWVFATHSKDRSQVELSPQVGVDSYKLNLWQTLRYRYPSQYMASAIAWEALAIPCSVADCNCAEADWKASQDIDTSRRWFQMLKWFGVPTKKASKMPNQSWFPYDFHMISFENLRVCVLILTSWSHKKTRVFFMFSSQQPGTHSSHGLGTLYLLHQLHEACQQTIQLLSPKKRGRWNPRETQQKNPSIFLGVSYFTHIFFRA